jgi:hypothetical protein
MSRNRPARRALVAASLVIVALGVAACSSTYTIDHKKGEKFLTGVLKPTGLQFTTVSCPSGLKAKQGDTFDCTVTGVDGSKGNITLKETNNKGHVVVSRTVVDTPRLEKTIEAGLLQKAKLTATVDCPDVHTLAPNISYTCKATSGSSTGTIDVSTDASSSLSWKLVQ